MTKRRRQQTGRSKEKFSPKSKAKTVLRKAQEAKKVLKGMELCEEAPSSPTSAKKQKLETAGIDPPVEKYIPQFTSTRSLRSRRTCLRRTEEKRSQSDKCSNEQREVKIDENSEETLEENSQYTDKSQQENQTEVTETDNDGLNDIKDVLEKIISSVCSHIEKEIAQKGEAVPGKADALVIICEDIPSMSCDLDRSDEAENTSQEPAVSTVVPVVEKQNDMTGQGSVKLHVEERLGSQDDKKGSTGYQCGDEGLTGCEHEDIGSVLSDGKEKGSQSKESISVGLGDKKKTAGSLDEEKESHGIEDGSVGPNGEEKSLVKLHGEQKGTSDLRGEKEESPGSHGEEGVSIGSQSKEKRPTVSTTEEKGSAGEEGEKKGLESGQKTLNGSQSEETGSRGFHVEEEQSLASQGEDKAASGSQSAGGFNPEKAKYDETNCSRTNSEVKSGNAPNVAECDDRDKDGRSNKDEDQKFPMKDVLLNALSMTTTSGIIATEEEKKGTVVAEAKATENDAKLISEYRRNVVDQQTFAKEFEALEDLLPDDDMGLFDDVIGGSSKTANGAQSETAHEGDRTIEFLTNELATLNYMVRNYQKTLQDLEKHFKISSKLY